MLTKGAIGNLVNRYRAVLKKCNLINTFGSLAVAGMLVLGGAGVAGATTNYITSSTNGTGTLTIEGAATDSTSALHAKGNTVDITGYDAITLTGSWDYITNDIHYDRNIFFAQKNNDQAGILNMGTKEQPLKIDLGDALVMSNEGGPYASINPGYGSIVFHAMDGTINVYANEINLKNYTNAFYAQNGGKLNIVADTITLDSDSRFSSIGIGTNANGSESSQIAVTANSLSVNAPNSAAISAASGYYNMNTDNPVKGSINLDIKDIDINAKKGIRANNADADLTELVVIKADTLDINTTEYGIEAIKNAKVDIDAATTTISTNNSDGNAYGVYGSYSDINFTGNTNITASSENTRATGIHLNNSKLNVAGPLDITANGKGYGDARTHGIYLAYSTAEFSDSVNITVTDTPTDDSPSYGLRLLADTNYSPSNAVFGGDVTISATSTGAVYGIQASGSDNNKGVDFNGNNVTINVSGNKEAVGILAQYGSSINASDSSNVSITASSETSNAIAIKNDYYGSEEGTIMLLGDVAISAQGAENANSYAIYNAANSGSTTVGNEGKTVAITGDIAAEGGTVTTTLGSAESYLTGAVTTKNGATTTLSMAEGSNWNATGDSSVTNLALDNGNVNILAGVDITADNATGSGNINMEDAAELGSFTAGVNSTATVNVQATDAEGKVKNADEVSAETLKEMRSQVVGLTNVTASAAEGEVNGAITVDAKGNATTARNTLMDDVLTMASVNTVALDRILTNDVRKRMGDIRADQNTTGVWMRWDGGKLKGDEGFTNNFNTIQIGGDTKVGKNCRLGVAGSFTHGDTDFARCNGELEGFSFAAYATWMADNGMFADVVARLGHFSTEMNVEGNKGDMDNRVASLSGEYGWRFNLCDQFFVEPQVELAYTYVNSEDLQLGDAKYSFDSVDSLTGRAGFVAGWNLPNDRGNVYARASVVHQFMGDAKITGTKGIAHNVQELDGDDTWLEYGIGANVKLTDNTYIWADVERTEGADIDEEWRGTVGIRYSF